jgi:CubicO group peptidase (beta-lactamase class C family)
MKYYSILFLAVLFYGLQACQKEVTAPQNIEQELINEVDNFGIASVAVSIVSDKEILWEWVYGYASIEDEKPANRLTLYQFMSISKVFLAVSVMQLVEDGKLSLDDDINKHLPWSIRNPYYPDIPITIRMLLNHTSGMAHPNGERWEGEFYYLYIGDSFPPLDEWLPEYLIPGGSSYRSSVWKDFQPGQQELYSNIGTSLLALIIEEVSGSSYPEYCRKNIFDPLDMHNTGFLYAEVDSTLLAIPHLNRYNVYPLYNYKHYPGANLKSNLEDFSHFMIAMLNRGNYNGIQILEPSSVDRMFEMNNSSTGISLIWKHCPGDCIGHSGGGEGFSSRFELFPDRNKAMIILSNTRNPLVYPQKSIYDLVRAKVNEF